MGNQMSWLIPPPPPGTVRVVIESAEPCANDAFWLRKWDPALPKPSWVDISDGAWLEFMNSMDALVRRYKPEALVMGTMFLSIFVGIIILHPSFGPLRHTMEVSSLISLTVLVPILGVFFAVGLSSQFRRYNMTIDDQIIALCRRTSTANTTFQFVGLFTTVCKPKGVRTYRALAVAPAGTDLGLGNLNVPGFAVTGSGLRGGGSAFGGTTLHSQGVVPAPRGVPVAAATAVELQPAAQPLQVVCPPTATVGDTIHITAPDGRMLAVTVPSGVRPGQPFFVEPPRPPPPVAIVTAVAVPMASC